MATIELRRIEKVYEGGNHAVRGLDLHVEDGELLVLLGPSGCGKSTVLRLLAGLETLTSGEIRIDGRRVDTDPPQDRDVAMVFQSYALYGHMTVRENIAFPLRMRGVRAQERQRRVGQVAALLELEEHLDARPAALSGGQQQRAAMGRALVREPRAFLLDEPLSNLDARLRGQVRTHIARLQERLGVTTLYVTHDQVEALSLGHRVAVLRGGRLQQVGPGQSLYERPANTFVAQFLGQPGMNLVPGRLTRSEGSWRVQVDGGSLQLPDGAAAGASEWKGYEGRAVILGVRPEALEVAGAEGPAGPRGEIQAVESLGHEQVLYVSSEIPTLNVSADPGGRGPAGDGGPLLAARTETGASPLTSGDEVTLRIRQRGAGWAIFDEEGVAITHA